MNMNEIVKGVSITKACKVKADNTSSEVKTINLCVEFDGVTLQGVFDKAMSSTVIAYQTSARAHFTSLVDKSTVTIKFVSPARTSIDPMVALLGEAAAKGVTIEELLKAKLAAMKLDSPTK